jgi:hypothetical protein
VEESVNRLAKRNHHSSHVENANHSTLLVLRLTISVMQLGDCGLGGDHRTRSMTKQEDSFVLLVDEPV